MLREKPVLAVLQKKLFTTAVSGEKNGVPRSMSKENYEKVMKLKGIRTEKDF
jgi:hypothetical protein